MKKARLFSENEEPILVSAEEVKEGMYSRYLEFVDPEYEFKVQFVKGARNNGAPYFRLYYSYEEYKRLFPDRADRYKIVADMRHYQETKWHSSWKESMSDFCSIEKCIKHPTINKWKFADAFYEKTKTCIEFQHSYIDWDFEERNEFYSELSINIIWLYDLPNANIREDENGNVEILEDNARGFFRISEKPENLEKYNVYIQVRSGMIYRVKKLSRREIPGKQKSTIRYFVPDEIYTKEEFINAIRRNTIGISQHDKESPKTIHELWNKSYSFMVIKNVESGHLIIINRNQHDEMFRDFSTDCIAYTYANDNKYYKNRKQYKLKHKDEKKAIWILIHAKLKSNNC